MLRRFFWVVPYTIVSVLCCLFFYYWLLPVIVGPGKTTIRINSSAGALELLQERGGDLKEVRQSGVVPPILIRNLPPDLSSLETGLKVDLFISLLLPQIIRANDELLETRTELDRILAKRTSFQRLTRDEQWWLNRLAWSYGCDAGDDVQLRLRVDTLPVSLVLAQAIEESGWGTSRFARVGNALYGQHFAEGGKGRYIYSLSGTARVAAFDSVYLATKAYLKNVNSGRAYEHLRKLRYELRKNSLEIVGFRLAEGLSQYSEKGQEYIRNLRYLIRQYDLEQLNHVVIDKRMKQYVVHFVSKKS